MVLKVQNWNVVHLAYFVFTQVPAMTCGQVLHARTFFAPGFAFIFHVNIWMLSESHPHTTNLINFPPALPLLLIGNIRHAQISNKTSWLFLSTHISIYWEKIYKTFKSNPHLTSDLLMIISLYKHYVRKSQIFCIENDSNFSCISSRFIIDLF